MAEKELKLVVDDGRKRVPIENTHGDEIGVFYFNPTDVGMVERFNRLTDKIDDVLAPLASVEIQADGEGVDEKSVAAITQAKENLFALLDEVFGGNLSEAFFGKIHPFTPVGGEFYCLRALEVLGGFIQTQFASETKQLDRNLTKYMERKK